MRCIKPAIGLVVILSCGMGGCASSDNAGPASQSQVNDVTKNLTKTQTSAPDVPIELRNKGVSPGTMVKKGG